jgi:hypothetical protein
MEDAEGAEGAARRHRAITAGLRWMEGFLADRKVGGWERAVQSLEQEPEFLSRHKFMHHFLVDGEGAISDRPCCCGQVLYELDEQCIGMFFDVFASQVCKDFCRVR